MTGEDTEDITAPEQVDTGLDDGVLGAQELHEGYNSYVGQTVTVSGEIAEVYGQNSLLIGEELWGEDLLVVIPNDATITGTTSTGAAVTGFGDLAADHMLQVTGTVREYMIADIESEYGLDIPTEVDSEVEEQEPVIIASSVQIMTEEMMDQ